MDHFNKDNVEQIDNADCDRLSNEINSFFTQRDTHIKAQVLRAKKIASDIQAITSVDVSARKLAEQERKKKFMDKVSKAQAKLAGAEDARNKLQMAKKENTKKGSETKNANQGATKTKLSELANAITIQHHETINSFFKKNLGTNLKDFFEHFVGLLRNIKQANELDVMLYFNGREGTKTEDAHKSLQFKLNNIDARDLDIDYVIDHEKGLEKNCGEYGVLKAWGQEFCKMAKEVLQAKKIREEESKIKSDLKEAEGLVEMWKEIVDTYANLKEKLNYDDECNYLEKFEAKKQALGEHIEAEVKGLSEALVVYAAAQNTQEELMDAFTAGCGKKEEEDLGAALIVNDAQKSKSKGKSRASRSRVFMGEEEEE